jgi:hypothetical protein
MTQDYPAPTSLSDYFRYEADWRRTKAEEYPDDKRNAQSAQALDSLADYIDSSGGGSAGFLSRHQFQFSLGGDKTSHAVVRYGFGYSVGDAQHEEFLKELADLCVEDAYEEVREGTGDDRTETLYPFEVEAAKGDVFLPRYYFQHRGGCSEIELEEAVESYRKAHAEDEAAA